VYHSFWIPLYIDYNINAFQTDLNLPVRFTLFHMHVQEWNVVDVTWYRSQRYYPNSIIYKARTDKTYTIWKRSFKSYITICTKSCQWSCSETFQSRPELHMLYCQQGALALHRCVKPEEMQSMLMFLYPVQDAERVPHSKRDAEMYVVSRACICKCQSDWGRWLGKVWNARGEIRASNGDKDVFCVVTACGLVGKHQRFGETVFTHNWRWRRYVPRYY
jgi:hypothetical protein